MNRIKKAIRAIKYFTEFEWLDKNARKYRTKTIDKFALKSTELNKKHNGNPSRYFSEYFLVIKEHWEDNKENIEELYNREKELLYFKEHSSKFVWKVVKLYAKTVFQLAFSLPILFQATTWYFNIPQNERGWIIWLLYILFLLAVVGIASLLNKVSNYIFKEKYFKTENSYRHQKMNEAELRIVQGFIEEWNKKHLDYLN